MINLEWYRSFIAVYQSGTVTAAAQLLFLTQPAVSQHISALEVTLGIKLFERRPRKMLPTEEAKVLYTQIISPISILEATTNTYHKEKNQIRSLVRIGAPQDFFYKKVLKVLNTSAVHYRVEFGPVEVLQEKLEQQKLDVVIATKKQPDNKIIEYKKIFTEHFQLVFSSRYISGLSKHIDTLNSFPDEQLLLEENWISYAADLPIIRRFWRETFNSRPSIIPSLILPSLTLICKAVAMGKGISVLPNYICEDAVKSGEIRDVKQFNNMTGNDIWIAYRKSDMSNKYIIMLINQLRLSKT